ncbi:MAG: pyrroline-5-carboxylate reductase [Alkalispirochaetaceae bacterium]
MKQIGIIGFGFMGEALIKGILAGQAPPAVGVIEAAEARRSLARDEYGCRDYGEDFASLFADSDLVILAIKPQQADELFPALRDPAGNTPVLSVLAGTTSSRIKELLGTRPVIRFMPNLAAAQQRSVVGVCFSREVEEPLRSETMALASAVGTPILLSESQMSAITGLSGSGIAFVFRFIHALALGGTRNGIPYSQSLEASIAVVEGAAAVLRSGGVHPEEMVSRVCSPGGTTIEGIVALEEGGMSASVIDAVTRAVERSQELEGGGR